jgi:UDP-2,3-diacylglucosamine hydrolase
MSVALVADAHLGGPGGAPEELLSQLENLPRQRCDRLLLLGDLFQIWVGDRRFETPALRQVMTALRKLRKQGIRIDYVEGNRDFFLKGSVYEGLFDRLGEEIIFESGGRTCLAIHGDGLNERDYLYRFWRRMSKNSLSRLMMRLLPGAVVRRVMVGTERRLAHTNFKHKARIPRDEILHFARRRLAEGPDLLLLGHFHEERRWTLPEGEVWLLDAWYRSRRVEWLEPE